MSLFIKAWSKTFAVYLGFIYSLIIVALSYQYESEICLEQALTIHALLTKQQCPDRLINPYPGSDGCPIVCKGRFIIENELYNRAHCVGYNITFRLNNTELSTLRDVPCKIPKCILEVLNFECMFSANTTNTTHLKPNRTLSNEVPRKKSDTCTDGVTIAIVNVSCVVLGIVLGIGGFVIAKRCRTRQESDGPTAVFYQPNYGDGGDILTMSIPMEAEYSSIEDSIKMIAKAVQVPSYKEDSSSESRSRENIYHHLTLEHSPKGVKGILVSSDTVRRSLSRNGSPSVNSEVINSENGSPKSNRSSKIKISPTGSEGTDKYYALEKDYLNFTDSP